MSTGGMSGSTRQGWDFHGKGSQIPCKEEEAALGVSQLSIPGNSGRCWALLQLLAWGHLSPRLSCLMLP